MTNNISAINKHFFLPEDRSLFEYDQVFAVSSIWVEQGMENVEGTYDLLVRDLPKNRNFLLFGGLEEIVEGILNWHFTHEQIQFLLKNKVITAKLALLLENFHFSGDIYAMPEGTIHFPGEPMVRITGKLWQINLFTLFVMNAVTSNTIFLSKIVRSLLAAKEKVKVITAPVTRAHSNESSMKFGRAAYFLGMPSACIPSFARKYEVPMAWPSTKAYHAFIKSFPSELEAMQAAVAVFPTISFMVDTYNFEQGVQNAILVAKEQRRRGVKEIISALAIDSGKNVKEYASRAKYARNALDAAGFSTIKIQVCGNFDETKIAQLVKYKAPVDAVIVATELVTVADDPKLECVFKLAEYSRDGKVTHTAKLANGKVSYPGKKQVFRTLKNGKLLYDVIGLEQENLGMPLLKKVVEKGVLVDALPSLDVIRAYVTKQLELLPSSLKRVDRVTKYSVEVSSELEDLLRKTERRHLKIT